MTRKKLFESFPPITPSEWKEKVLTDLKGADYHKKLVWKTTEGFDAEPYYTAEDLERSALYSKNPSGISALRNAKTGWTIRQDFAANKSTQVLNAKLRNAIEREAESLGIDLQGLNPLNEKKLYTLLKGINPENILLHFKNSSDPFMLMETLLKIWAERKIDLQQAGGSINIDPLAELSTEGSMDENHFGIIHKLLSKYSNRLPGFKFININAGLIQDGGSTLTQELGLGLAMANEYLKTLTDLGLDPSLVVKNMHFTFAAGTDYFMEIAKLRAARYLWDGICREWGIAKDARMMYIHSRSASWNLTVYDPNVNMLRTTTGAMSASLGGSDEISLLPFDNLYKEENDFTMRVARNTQVILREEAYFDKVADPGAGSYYIEQLTDKLSEATWRLFVETEKRGGYIKAFKKGWIAEQVQKVAEEKRSKAAAGRTQVLGVNQYPNFNELILEQGILPPEGGLNNNGQNAIRPFRVAAETEQLRLRTEKHQVRPKVFLLKFGDPKWMTARAMFAGNFFACAGYEILDNPGFETVEKGLETAIAQEPDIVVLCSADEHYAEAGTLARKKLTPEIQLVIAGYPKNDVDQLKEAGVDHFIHVRSNILEELSKFHKLLGIE